MSTTVQWFLFGLLLGATSAGVFAVAIYMRAVETLRLQHGARLAVARRKSYAQGYEARAALEFSAREEAA